VHRIIPRSEWGARYGSSGIKRTVGDLECWLHHSVTVAPNLVAPFDDDFAAIRLIEDIGRQRFGSYGFPYTFAVTPAALIFEGHPIDEVGAHTQGHNTAGAGIVLVGNYETDKPTDAQMHAVAWLLQEGVRRGWWRTAALDGGHRDTKATACPGKYAYPRIGEINELARTPIEEDDMPTAKEIATEVWKVQLGKGSTAGLFGDTNPSASLLLKRSVTYSASADVQIAALTAAVQALAVNQGLDPEALHTLIRGEVRAAATAMLGALASED